MKLCPKCEKARHVSERIEPDKKTKGKNWLITYCAKCGYNHDLEVYTGTVLSPQEEMDKYPEKGPQKYWPGL